MMDFKSLGLLQEVGVLAINELLVRVLVLVELVSLELVDIDLVITKAVAGWRRWL
jgi:hypothetical protein